MNSTGLTIKVDFIEREDRTNYADLLDISHELIFVDF